MTTKTSSISRYVFTVAMFFIIWLGFTTSFEKYELITGLVVSLVIAFYAFRSFSVMGMGFLSPRKLLFLIKYIFVFLKALFTANLDVAMRVLKPSMPINPGIVKFKTSLQSEMGRMVLANSITLTPGTLTVDVVDDMFYIHWLNTTTTDPVEAHKEIAEEFETILKEIFG